MSIRNLLLGLVCCLIVCTAGIRAEDGSLKGVVKYDGDPPANEPIQVPAKDQPGCKCNVVENENLLVDKATKGIKHVIIRVMDVKAPPAPAPAAVPTLDQQGCKFSPHIIIIPPGSTLDLLNPDKIIHNFHTTPLDLTNPPTNFAMMEEKRTLKTTFFAEPEIIQVQCDMHPWMKGFIVVHDPRFVAVTGTDGAFEIKGIPPGKYKVNIFHGSLGGKEGIDVEIKAGAATDMGDFKLPTK